MPRANAFVDDAAANADLLLGGKERLLQRGVPGDEPADANAGNPESLGERRDADRLGRLDVGSVVRPDNDEVVALGQQRSRDDKEGAGRPAVTSTS